MARRTAATRMAKREVGERKEGRDERSVGFLFEAVTGKVSLSVPSFSAYIFPFTYT